MPTHAPLNYDPLSLEDDPYPAYRQLRDNAPLYRGSTVSGEFWALSRFDDVQAAARDWETFSSAQGNDLDDTGLLFGESPAMDLSDPPVHTRHRNALRDAFSPNVVSQRLEPLARRKVSEIVNRLREKDNIDFARDLAYPLPLGVICGWLGFPDDDLDHLAHLHSAMLDRVQGRVELPDHAIRARDEMWDYIRAAMAERRVHDRDDLLSAIVRAQIAGKLSEGEALANALFFFDAGIVSTTALIGNSFLHLHNFQDQRQLIRKQPEIIPAAIEELLRFDAPFQWFTRVTTRELVMNGESIPAGARVILIWASANRDERRWDRPDELLVTRKQRPHLSFSAGIHHCLGAPIARMEVRILFEELMPLLADYELVGPVVRRITPSERTISSLQARVKWEGNC